MSFGQRLRKFLPAKLAYGLLVRFTNGQEPVYYLFDHAIRPVLMSLGRRSARARFAISMLCDDILYETQSKGRARISSDAVKSFLGADYSYGKEDLDAQIPMNQRLSGQILPLLEPILRDERVRCVLEIGAANGSITRFLGNKFPDKTFLGVDFQRPPAQPVDPSNI